MKSLYVHFPFCEAKCHYCDFYSLGRERTHLSDPEKFETALKKEVTQSISLLNPELETVFFGGGTPSMTSCDSMKRALEPLWKSTRITTQTEWTMEANPSSIELKALQSYREFGVNRISMGVQSLNTHLLAQLGRVHSREMALHALELIFKAQFENVSVDLLCGVPYQTLFDLEESLELLTQFPITHLSCYLLTLPPHHKMSKNLPPEEQQLEQLLFIHSWMSDAGFEHYEISNYSKPGKRAQHNLNYWKGNSYLGLGPSAHSYDSHTYSRWKNVSSLRRYVELLKEGKSVMEWKEELTSEQIRLERWMLALRLSEGFPEEWLESGLQKQRAQIFRKQELLELHPSNPRRIRLTPKGFALSDQIIRSLV